MRNELALRCRITPSSGLAEIISPTGCLLSILCHPHLTGVKAGHQFPTQSSLSSAGTRDGRTARDRATQIIVTRYIWQWNRGSARAFTGYLQELGLRHPTGREIVDARGFTISNSTIPFLSAKSRQIELVSLERLAAKTIMS
jgi:hypothetical protein